jgi:hypothetical protein
MRWFRVTASVLAPDETIEPECRITKVERARFTAASTCGQGFGQHVIDQLGGLLAQVYYGAPLFTAAPPNFAPKRAQFNWSK